MVFCLLISLDFSEGELSENIQAHNTIVFNLLWQI